MNHGKIVSPGLKMTNTRSRGTKSVQKRRCRVPCLSVRPSLVVTRRPKRLLKRVSHRPKPQKMDILISSTEELSPEDRLLLASSKRVEPQGQEHIDGGKGGDMSHGQRQHQHHEWGTDKGLLHKGNKGSTDFSSSDDEDDGILYQNVGPFSNPPVGGTAGSISGSSRAGGGRPGNMSLDSNSHSAYNTLIIHQNNGSLLADTWIPASHEFASLATGSNRNSTCSNPRKSQSPSRDHTLSHGMHGQTNSGTDYESMGILKPSELSDIPRDYLNQLTVLKHLAKEVQQDPISDPPSKLLRSASFSRSQPDLSQSQQMPVVPPSSQSYYYAPPQNKGSMQLQHGDDRDQPSTSVQMLEILMRENSNLRAELANARMRIQTIHKLEAELSRLQRQHASLFESAERRESLERTARVKLSSEVKRLTAVNRELLSSSNSLQNLSQYSLGSDVEIYRKELSKKDATIVQLNVQNKELTTTKERQDIELGAQRATLEEQRTHIDILDSALTTAQGNVVRLEEECRRNQDYAEKVVQLQRALSSLQVYTEKREQNEKKLRTQLESEITDLKLQLASKNAKSNVNSTKTTQQSGSNCNGNNTPTPATRSAPPPYPGTSSNPPSTPNSAANSNNNLSHVGESTQDLSPGLSLLQEKLRLSEEKIQSLTSVVQRWEHFFGQEQDMTTTGPNTPSWSSRGGTPHFTFAPSEQDLPSRAADLEWKIKDLECRLVEKDNLLRAMQQQTYSGYSHAPQKSVNHPISVSLASMRYGGMDPLLFYEKVGKCESEPPSYANLPPKLRLGGSGSSLAKNSNESLGYGTSNNGASEPESVSSDGFHQTKTIDEQLKELNTQLLSKGTSPSGNLMMSPPLKTNQQGLCCIPGFTNPSTATRKGKIPQSLLEGLTTQDYSSSPTSPVTFISISKRDPSPNSKVLPPLPRPPVSTAPLNSNTSSHSHGPSTTVRTSSGPPFEGNVFTPCVKGLPPKAPHEKCRSLEREGKQSSNANKSSKSCDDNDKEGSKRSLVEDDISQRCKSLDRREQKREKGKSVSSKAAFFGNLLLRRSPSPSRKDESKEKEKATPETRRKFLFSKKEEKAEKVPEIEEEKDFLQQQGRASQSRRHLEGLANNTGPPSTSASPWVQRRNSAGKESSASEQKWGKVVNTRFGLRYTFGAPK